MAYFVENSLWAAVAAVGFAVLFNVPPRILAGCALMGASGYLGRALMLEAGFPLELSSLAAALLIGFLSDQFAKRWRTPRIVFSVPGVIPLVPGALAYQTMLGVFELILLPDLSQEGYFLLLQTAVNGIKTGLVLVALALGTIAPNLLFRRPKPVV